MPDIDERTFFIYDHTVLQREEDDLKDAIVYFYPPSVQIDTQCCVCGQLMGMVGLFKNLMDSPPSLIKLQTIKFAVHHTGQYSMALAASLKCPDDILSAQLKQLFKLFCFFHKSLPAFYKKAASHELQADMWSGYVQFIRHYGHTVSASFQSVPYTEIPKGIGEMIPLQANCLLQHCQLHFHVLSGCVFYRNSVVTTQLPTDLTFRLLIIRPQQFSSERSETPYPDGTHIVPVYLTPEEHATVNEKQSNLPSTYHLHDSSRHAGEQPIVSKSEPSSEEYEASSSSQNDPVRATNKNAEAKTGNENSDKNLEKSVPLKQRVGEGVSDAALYNNATEQIQFTKLLQSSSALNSSSSESPAEGASDKELLMRQPLLVTSDPAQIMENIKAVAARGSEAFSRASTLRQKPVSQSSVESETSRQTEVKDTDKLKDPTGTTCCNEDTLHRKSTDSEEMHQLSEDAKELKKNSEYSNKFQQNAEDSNELQNNSLDSNESQNNSGESNKQQYHSEYLEGKQNENENNSGDLKETTKISRDSNEVTKNFGVLSETQRGPVKSVDAQVIDTHHRESETQLSACGEGQSSEGTPACVPYEVLDQKDTSEVQSSNGAPVSLPCEELHQKSSEGAPASHPCEVLDQKVTLEAQSSDGAPVSVTHVVLDVKDQVKETVDAEEVEVKVEECSSQTITISLGDKLLDGVKTTSDRESLHGKQLKQSVHSSQSGDKRYPKAETADSSQSVQSNTPQNQVMCGDGSERNTDIGVEVQTPEQPSSSSQDDCVQTLEQPSQDDCVRTLEQPSQNDCVQALEQPSQDDCVRTLEQSCESSQDAAVEGGVRPAKDGDPSLVPLELYVQTNSEMVLLLLMDKGSKKNLKLVSSMWKSILPQLADLEAKLQMSPRGQSQVKQQEALANYQYLQYNSVKKSLSGRIAVPEGEGQPASQDPSQFCENAVFMHDASNKNRHLKEIIMRRPGSMVYGHRVGVEESFFQRSLPNKTTGAPSEKDPTMQINKKIREKLYKDQHMSLL